MGEKPYSCRVLGEEIGLNWLSSVRICNYSFAHKGHWHTHPGVELICRLKGELEYEFDDVPGFSLRPGHILVIPPGCRHRLANEVDMPGLRVSMLFRSELPKGSGDAFFSRKSFRVTRDMLLEKSLVQFRCPAFLLKRFAAVAKIISGAGKGGAEGIDLVNLRLFLLDAFVSLSQARGDAQTSGEELMQSAVGHLSKDISSPFSTKRFAEFVGYGQTRMFQLFRNCTGVTPKAWLTRQRLKRACELLSGSGQSVQSVAASVGIGDVSYFCRLFRKHIGQTPLSYRKSSGKSRTARTRRMCERAVRTVGGTSKATRRP